MEYIGQFKFYIHNVFCFCARARAPPEMDGFQAVKEIHRLCDERGTHRVPVVAVTASVSTGLHEECREAGIAQVITKPFGPMDVMPILHSVIESGRNIPPASPSVSTARSTPSTDSSTETLSKTVERSLSVSPSAGPPAPPTPCVDAASYSIASSARTPSDIAFVPVPNTLPTVGTE